MRTSLIAVAVAVVAVVVGADVNAYASARVHTPSIDFGTNTNFLPSNVRNEHNVYHRALMMGSGHRE